MDEEQQGRIYDLIYELRGLSSTLLSAGHGSLEEPDKIIEHAAGQVLRLADELGGIICEPP